MRNKAEESAKVKGQSLAEWLRRAVQEKLDRESGTVKDVARIPANKLKEMIREEINQMKDEIKSEIKKKETR